MVSINQPPSWQFDSNESYVPISYEGTTIGFAKPDYAHRIVEILNEEDRHRKAMRLACYDLVARSGGNTDSVDEVMGRYLAKIERPKQGTGVIALLLRERKVDLDLNEEEFIKFCDSYRLSKEELQGIYNGEELQNSQLVPLSRILGISVDEIIEVWKGKE